MKQQILSMAKRVVASVVARSRVEDRRCLFWSVYYPFNFGDWIGPFLFLRYTDGEPWFRLPDRYSRETVYMTAGSILGLARENAIIWGSGVLVKDQSFPEPFQTLAVRGPLSREAYTRQGYECPELYGDPGILLPLVYHPKTVEPEDRHPLGIVPHFRDYEAIRSAFAGNDNVVVIDVRYPIEEVVDRICSCRRIVSSSLHGIIVAHAYGIPAVWILANHLSGDGTKYHDYFYSAGITPYSPAKLKADEASSVTRLCDLVDDSYLPDLKALQEPLLRACPFLPLEREIASG